MTTKHLKYLLRSLRIPKVVAKAKIPKSIEKSEYATFSSSHPARIDSAFRTTRFTAWNLLLSLLMTLAITRAGADTQVLIETELEALTQSQGVRVIGLEKTRDQTGKRAGVGLYEQLRNLLAEFDHIILQKPDGSVEQVLILGRKSPWVPPPSNDIVLATTRMGKHHLVEAVLIGANERKMNVRLLVDTGADIVVLPRSIMEILDLDRDDFVTRKLQTANGKTDAVVGTLSAVSLGHETIEDVDVAFIEDKKIGANGLLGMSVLSRYQVTLDDNANRLTLKPEP